MCTTKSVTSFSHVAPFFSAARCHGTLHPSATAQPSRSIGSTEIKKGKPPPSPRHRRLPGPQARRRRSTRRSPQGRSTRHRCGRRAPPDRYLRLPQPTSRGQRPLPDLRLKHAVSFCFLASNRRSHDDHNSGSCGREMRCRPQTRPRPCLCVARRWYCPVPTPALFTVNQRRRHRLFCFNLYELRPISICFASAYMKYGRIGC